MLDNFTRGVPDWLAPRRRRSDPARARHPAPLPADLGHFEFVIHAAGIASPTYYRLHPDRDDGREHRRTADPARPGGRRPRLAAIETEGFLFFSSSEIYGDPSPEHIPTPETYRGNVSCTGPRACYDESKRYGETLCVNFARQHDLPVTIARPFNNYGPGLKITDRRRHPRPRARRARGPRRHAALRRLGHADVLLRRRRRRRVTTRSSSGAGQVSRTTSAPRSPRSRSRISPSGSWRSPATSSATRAASCTRTSREADYLVDNPSRRRPSIDKARSELGYEPSVGLDEGLERSLAWYAENRGGEEA